MNPLSHPQDTEADVDELAERELFARRARAMPSVAVPALGEVLRKAGPRETPLPRGRIAVGAALAAACFAAVVTAHPTANTWVESHAVAAEVDAGVAPPVVRPTLASWDFGGEDETCQMDCTASLAPDEALECVSPRAAVPAAPPVPVAPAAPAHVACESEDVCSFSDQ